MIRVTRIGLVSWMKVSAALYVLVMFVIIGVYLGLALVLDAGASAAGAETAGPWALVRAPLGPGLLASIAVYAALGALAGLIQGLFLNAALRLSGGLDLEVG